jgi:hypothetical protein
MVGPRGPRPGSHLPPAAAGHRRWRWRSWGRRKKCWRKNVETISTAISTNSTFHKNVVTFLKNVGRILKKRKVVSNIFKMLTKIS